MRSAHACRRLDGRHTRRGVAAALGVVASAMPPGFADPARASDMRAPRSRGGTRRWRSAAATLSIALQPPVTSPAWQLASELGGDGRDSAAGRHTIREEKSPPRRPPRAPRSGEKRVEEDCHCGFLRCRRRRRGEEHGGAAAGIVALIDRPRFHAPRVAGWHKWRRWTCGSTHPEGLRKHHLPMTAQRLWLYCCGGPGRGWASSHGTERCP